jgi:DNA repair exonuclease SbcCD ATPase subunit
MSKMEAKLASLESKIDDKVKPKYDEAKTLIDAMKAQTSDEQLRNLNQLDSMIKEIESYIQSQNVPSVPTESLAADTRPPTESKQERAEKQDRIKQREAKLQRLSAEIARLDAKLAALEPQIDDNTKPKFEKAQSLLSRLKSQTSAGTEAFKALRTIDSLIGEIVSYIESQDSDEDQDTGVSVDTKPVEPARPSDRDQ